VKIDSFSILSKFSQQLNTIQENHRLHIALYLKLELVMSLLLSNKTQNIYDKQICLLIC